MRVLILFLVGLFVGAAGTAVLIQSLNRGTSYPRGVMSVMGHQMKAMNASIKQNRCAASDIAPRLQTIRLVANDIEVAFDDMQGDAQFTRYAGALRAAADGPLATPLTTCAATQTALNKIDQSCDNCHRDFKD